jgi:hypothetical protein
MLTAALAPAQQKTPLSTVPFNRDPDFIGRRDILIALDLKFSQRESHKRVVLVGLGGVGYVFSPYSLIFLTFFSENHKLLLNTPIGSLLVILRPGFSGCTLVLLRDLNKAINKSPLY